MSGELGIFYILANNDAFNAFIGGSAAAANIFYDRIKQGSQPPFVMIRRQPGTVYNDDKNGRSDLAQDMIQVVCSANDKKTVIAMATAARNCLDRAVSPGTYNGVFIESVKMHDSDSFEENLIDKEIYSEEQLYQVMTRQ
jgi:hypothetical protein